MLLAAQWPSIKVIRTGEVLLVEGRYTASAFKNDYQFRVMYHPNKGCKAWIIKPQVPLLPAIHINQDGSMCLYYWREYNLNKRFSLSNEIIPWILEWTHYYEIWLANGNIWVGPEAPHG